MVCKLAAIHVLDPSNYDLEYALASSVDIRTMKMRNHDVVCTVPNIRVEVVAVDAVVVDANDNHRLTMDSLVWGNVVADHYRSKFPNKLDDQWVLDDDHIALDHNLAADSPMTNNDHVHQIDCSHIYDQEVDDVHTVDSQTVADGIYPKLDIFFFIEIQIVLKLWKF